MRRKKIFYKDLFINFDMNGDGWFMECVHCGGFINGQNYRNNWPCEHIDGKDKETLLTIKELYCV